MGTNAVISFVDSSKVIAKLCVGCNGTAALKFANHVCSHLKSTDLAILYNEALRLGLGCKLCLVGLSDSEEVYWGDGRPLPTPFRDTYQLPLWNPRNPTGQGAVCIVVDTELWQVSYPPQHAFSMS